MFSTPDTPEGQAVSIVQDNAGFFYLNALVRMEGYQTPFINIDEISLYLEKELKLIRQDDI